MKRIFFFALLLSAAMASEAMSAACPTTDTTRLTAGQIGSALTDKLVCAARPGATDKNNKWAEHHLKVGDLIEHAGGSNHKVDPLHKVGTWEAVSTAGSKNDVVRYNYGTGGTYNWAVWQQAVKGPPGSASVVYHFCDGATLIASGTTQTLPAQSAPNPCGY